MKIDTNRRGDRFSILTDGVAANSLMNFVKFSSRIPKRNRKMPVISSWGILSSLSGYRRSQPVRRW
jgi:hypothetical protein